MPDFGLTGVTRLGLHPPYVPRHVPEVVLVFVQRAIQDLTFNRGSRLITGVVPTGFNFSKEIPLLAARHSEARSLRAAFRFASSPSLETALIIHDDGES